jgi:hypothetical protein
MSRVFSPSAIKIKNGTPRFHKKDKAERRAKWREERSEVEHQEQQAESELNRIDEELTRNYAAGELSYKHGHGSFEDERQVAKADAKKGEPHGPGGPDGS